MIFVDLDPVYILMGAVLVIISLMFLRRRSGQVRNQRPLPADIVCLYQVGRGPWTPSLSPFPLKLETFLRMAKIPYMNDHSGKMSGKGKTPWMMYNGQAIADSQLCMEHLKQVRDIDVDSHLSEVDKAVARALRVMTEENFYWTLCYETFVRNPASLDILLKDIFPWLKTFLFKMLMGHTVKKEMWGHGIGRHADLDIWDIGRRDLKALADFLGDKQFMMGEKPSETDCAIFGMLAMVVWQMKESRHEQMIYSEHTNLVKYCERMRDLYWPDWEQRCKKGAEYVDDHQHLYLPNKSTN